MDTPNGGQPARQERPSVAIKLGHFTLTGPRAAVVAAVVFVTVLLLIIALIVYIRPAVRLLLSAVVWIVLFIYWNIPVKNAAPAESAEAIKSRQLHQNLLLAGILLLFIPVPILSRRFLPQTSLVIAA